MLEAVVAAVVEAAAAVAVEEEVAMTDVVVDKGCWLEEVEVVVERRSIEIVAAAVVEAADIDIEIGHNSCTPS